MWCGNVCIMKKEFIFRYSFDLLILGMDEPREIELEINLLLFNKKITLKGSPGTLDCEPLNFVWDDEWEGDNQSLLDFMVKEVNKVGDQIEYSFNDGGEGEENFFLSLFLIPRLNRLFLMDEKGNTERYLFNFEDYLDENNIQRRKWEMEPVDKFPSGKVHIVEKLENKIEKESIGDDGNLLSGLTEEKVKKIMEEETGNTPTVFEKEGIKIFKFNKDKKNNED